MFGLVFVLFFSLCEEFITSSVYPGFFKSKGTGRHKQVSAHSADNSFFHLYYFKLCLTLLLATHKITTFHKQPEFVRSPGFPTFITMPYRVAPMTPLMEWKDTEETLSNFSVFLINKNVERSIYLCVLRKKKRQEILK